MLMNIDWPINYFRRSRKSHQDDNKTAIGKCITTTDNNIYEVKNMKLTPFGGVSFATTQKMLPEAN